VGGKRGWRLAVLTTAWLLSAVAWASPDPSAAVDLYAGGGYDSNLFLLVAADPDSPTFRPYSGGFLRLAPTGTLALSGDDLRLELRAATDVRQTFGSGTLFIEDAQLTLIRPELGPFDLRVGVTGGRFDATTDDSLRFESAGGLLEAAWRLFDSWRFTASYRLLGRWFGAPAAIGVTRDLAQDAGLRAAWTPALGTQLAASAGYLDLRSAFDAQSADTPGVTGRFDRFWAGLDGVHVSTPGLTLFASVWAGTLRPDGGPADLQLGGAAGVSTPIIEGLEAVLRYDGMIDRRSANSAETSGFQHHVITAGLQWRPGTARRAPRPSSGPSGAEAPAVVDGRVHFSLRAPGAASARVVGSWNDWARDVAAQVMRPGRAPGTWEVRLDLPPGTYRFQFVLDGRAVRPPAATRYEVDDFGGEDGIVEIQAAR